MPVIVDRQCNTCCWYVNKKINKVGRLSFSAKSERIKYFLFCVRKRLAGWLAARQEGNGTGEKESAGRGIRWRVRCDLEVGGV